MMQYKCDCGRIGEVRRRSNGKRLRYKHCKCSPGLGGIETAIWLEKNEQENIGEYGEFWNKPAGAETEKVEPEPEQASAEWVPDAETMPDDVEAAPEDEPKSPVMKYLGYGLLFAGGVVGAVFGFKAYKGGVA